MLASSLLQKSFDSSKNCEFVVLRDERRVFSGWDLGIWREDDEDNKVVEIWRFFYSNGYLFMRECCWKI